MVNFNNNNNSNSNKNNNEQKITNRLRKHSIQIDSYAIRIHTIQLNSSLNANS